MGSRRATPRPVRHPLTASTPARVTVLVVGTAGDARPVAALGHALRHRGHRVTVATSHDHRALIEEHGLDWSDLGPSYSDEIDRAAERLGHNPASDARLLRERLERASAGWADQARAATAGAGLVIGSGTLMGALAGSIAETRGVPAARIDVMPLTPTRSFPPPVPPPSRSWPGPVNHALFRLVRLAVWRACFAAPLAAARRDLALPPFPWTGPSTPLPTLCCWSPALLPAPADWPRSGIRVTGAWPLPHEPSEPDPALRRFVEAGDPPVYVGFGSMRLPATDRARLAHTLARFLDRSGRRAVIGTGTLDGRRFALDRRVHLVDTVPFGWLLPRVSLAIHHGGAGTVMAAARAGVPQLVVPFVLDQFFWSWRLVRLGVSPPGLPRRQALTGAALARAAERCDRPNVRAAARRLARRMHGEDGVRAALDALDGWGLL